MKRKLNQLGYSAVEVILIVIALGIVGGTGFYVYKANKEDVKITDSSIQKEGGSAKKAEEADPTKDWKSYSSKPGKYSLKYPPTWVTAEHPELCSEGILLLGADKNSVGVCASESFGQIAIYANKGDVRAEMELRSANYPDLKTQEVIVDGVKGKKQAGTYKKTGEGFGPEDGDYQIVYTFFANGMTYQATYSSGVSTKYPDVKKDFELMVEKTLKFTP